MSNPFTIKAVIEQKGPAFKLFNAQDRKTVLRTALRDAGEAFVSTYIPLRFTEYARKAGYHASENWYRTKRHYLGKALPFLGLTPPGGGNGGGFAGPTRNAEKMAVAMSRGVRVAITGTSQTGDISIKAPLGHPILPRYAKIFTKILPWETRFVVERFEKSFSEYIALGRPPTKRSKKLTIRGATSAIKPRSPNAGTTQAR